MLDRPSTITNWTLTIGQVAQMFRESEVTFRRRLQERNRLGFPNRIPGSRMWSRPVVEHWFRTNGGTYVLGAEPAPADAIDEARDELARQYA